jgi:two-component system response regulator AtoC
MTKVLVVDDEDNLRLVLRTLLHKHGYEVQVSASAEHALAQLEHFRPDFVLADVKMPGLSGIEFCAQLKREGNPATVIMMSAYGSVDMALQAMKAGAYDYISKPFKQDEVLLVLRKAEEREQLRRENKALRETLQQSAEHAGMIGKSEAITRVFRTIEKVAEYRTTVLIQGESGTGKELVAHAIHDRSPRAKKPFVAVNCGAIPENLLESELFGHKKGAFTDAAADKRGLFEEADGGTLFLDEIGELPLTLQVKLLRALQEGTIRRLGDTRDLKVDVRVVAATMRDLRKEVDAGSFREDLFYRINVLQIFVPPLRERKEDIAVLVDHFLNKNNARLGTHFQAVEPKARKLLLEYSWPGNVRELENVMERAMVLAESTTLTAADLPDKIRDPQDPVATTLASGEVSIKKSVRFIEETLIRRALERTSGNRTMAARMLEISHRALLYKLKEYGIK